MQIQGQTIENVRRITEEEMEEFFPIWEGSRRPVVLELGSGDLLFPARDEEAFGPAEMFAADGAQMYHLRPTEEARP